MKRNTFVEIVILATLFQKLIATTPTLSQPRTWLAATSVGNLALFAGGTNSTGSSDRVDIYNYESNEWTIATLSQPRGYLAATTVGSLALFAGGYDAFVPVYSTRVDIYNDTSKTWSNNTRSQPCAYSTAATVETLAMVAGGCNNDKACNEVASYDNASNTWSNVLHLSQPRCHLAATAGGDLAIFAGGYPETYGAQVDIYNYTAKGWNSSESLSQPRAYLAATTVGDLAIFAGGCTQPAPSYCAGGYSDRVDIYNYTSNTWNPPTRLSQPRAYLAATHIGSLALFAGGYNGTGASDRVDIYNYTSNSWTTATLSQPRSNLAATTVGDLAIFAGGQYGSILSAQVDIYNITSKEWTPQIFCSIGTFINLSASVVSCSNCSAGTFANTTNLFSCSPCPNGTYSNMTAATECIPCTVGTHCQNGGCTSCSPCPVGTYSNLNNTGNCSPCPTGTYGNVTGATSYTQCTTCPNGTYCQSGGCVTCGTCQPGTAPAAAIQCDQCPPGTFSSNGTACTLCPPGTACNFSGASSLADCQPCQPGNAPSESASSCEPCPPGSYATETSCEKCSPGKASNATGADNSDTCQPCDSGFYSPEGASNCTQCPSGTTSEVGASSCYKTGISTSLKIGIAVIVVAFILVLIGVIVALIRRSRKRLTGYIKLDQVDTGHLNVIEHIEIVGRLGGGLFGDVFSGIWNGTTDVALKKLKSKDHFEEFAKEADVLQSLNHPNIVRFLGIHTSESGSQYIVMEFMSKGSVDSLLTREEQTLTLVDLLSIAKDAAAGMLYLEQQKIVHRDLALRNLLAAPGEHEKYIVKVSDFGLSRQIKEEGFYMKLENNGVPVRWSAPEVLERGVYTLKSDVWSFGIALWELFSYGQLPYGGMGHPEVIQKVVGGYRLTPPDGCPEEIRRLMLQCWESQPEDRPGFKDIYEKIFSIWNDIQIGARVAIEIPNRQVSFNTGSQIYNNQELRVFGNYDSNYNTEDMAPRSSNYNNI